MDENNVTEKKKQYKSWTEFPRYMGQVKKWFPDRGFGFIKSWQDGENYFCHVSKCEDGELVVGSTVEFGLMQDKRDPEKQFCVHVLTVEVPEGR